MVENYKKCMILDGLRNTATVAAPSAEEYDRILQAVMEAVGKPDAVTFTEADARVDRLSSLRVVYTIGKAVTSKTSAMVVAAGLFLAALFGRDVPGKAITFLPDEDVPLASTPPMSEMVPVAEQGYRVGPAVRLDADLSGPVPLVERYLVMEDVLRIYLEDNGFGIDWSQISSNDLYGRPVVPLESDETQSMVGYLLPQESFEIHLNNRTGGRAMVAVNAYNT